MELDWLDDFTALAAAQNFSRAAQARHVTQPAFSRRIQMLEAWVGVPLFLRQPRRVLLTAAGEQFRPHAENITRDLRQARAAALEAAGRAETALSIAATHALSFSFFPGWIRSLGSAGQPGALNLMSDSMEACEDMMLRGEASFLLCHRHRNGPDKLGSRQFRFVCIGQDVLVPLSAPGPDGTALWAITGEGSGPVPYLAYARPSGIGRILEDDWKMRGLAFGLKQTMTARLAAALLTMAEDGLGIAWAPLSLAADRLATGKLVEAGPRAIATPVEIVLYRPNARLGQTAEHFWTAINPDQR